MVECPPIQTNFPNYILLHHALSCITIPINLYAIYCIIWKSTKAMRTYRWHLLWHQILTAAVDFLIGVLAIPIYLLPFPMVYPTGFISYLMPTHIAVLLIFLLITTSLAAVVQLFVYRYLKATGREQFPWRYIFLLVFTYTLCATPSVGFEYIYPRDQPTFLRQMAENYSCLTHDILDIPGLAGYPPDLIGTYVGLPIGVLNVYMIVVCSLMIHWTKSFLRGNNLSPNTARLERKFLLTLILQVITPIVIVHVPGLVFMYIQANRVYGYEVVGLICITTLSVYGALCGIFIIVLTPNYRSLSCCGKTPTKVVSTFDTSMPPNEPVVFHRSSTFPPQRWECKDEKLFIRKT